jgi:hypothetical protein
MPVIKILTNLGEFKQKMSSANSNIDYCLDITLRILDNPVAQYYHEVYFDFGILGKN